MGHTSGRSNPLKISPWQKRCTAVPERFDHEIVLGSEQARQAPGPAQLLVPLGPEDRCASGRPEPARQLEPEADSPARSRCALDAQQKGIPPGIRREIGKHGPDALRRRVDLDLGGDLPDHGASCRTRASSACRHSAAQSSRHRDARGRSRPAGRQDSYSPNSTPVRDRWLHVDPRLRAPAGGGIVALATPASGPAPRATRPPERCPRCRRRARAPRRAATGA